MFEREAHPSVRVALAVSIALSNAQQHDDALQFLTANLLTDDEIDQDYHAQPWDCLLYTSPSPRDRQKSRMPSSA